MPKKKKAEPKKKLPGVKLDGEFATKTLADLVPADYNPRAIDKKRMNGLEKSIDRFGLVQPIVWNKRTGRIVGGHQRLKVLHARGVKETTVVVVDLDEPEEKALNITLNNPHVEGVFTEDLQGLLSEVRDFDPTIFGDLNLGDLLEPEKKERPHYTLRDVENVRDEELADRYKWVKLGVLDFSGGRDSSTALLWAKQNLPQARIVALYVDQGADFPGFETHVRRVAKLVDVELEVLRTPTSILERLFEKGWPSWKGPWCQTAMHDVLAEWVRANGSPEDTLRMTGTRSKQKKAGSKMAPDDPLPSTPEYRALAPIFDWTEETAARHLEAAGVPLWDGYSRGLCRTACWMCPGQRLIAYAALRREFPCVFRALADLGHELGGIRFWQASLKGKTLAQAADRGDEMLAAKRVA